MLLPFIRKLISKQSWRITTNAHTHGGALGYVLIAPSGRIAHNYCVSYFLHIT